MYPKVTPRISGLAGLLVFVFSWDQLTESSIQSIKSVFGISHGTSSVHGVIFGIDTVLPVHSHPQCICVHFNSLLVSSLFLAHDILQLLHPSERCLQCPPPCWLLAGCCCAWQKGLCPLSPASVTNIDLQQLLLSGTYHRRHIVIVFGSDAVERQFSRY